jgi:hypothetical protein
MEKGKNKFLKRLEKGFVLIRNTQALFMKKQGIAHFI